MASGKSRARPPHTEAGEGSRSGNFAPAVGVRRHAPPWLGELGGVWLPLAAAAASSWELCLGGGG